MSESALWKRMRGGIADYCFVQRLENLVGTGVPDVVLHDRKTGKEAWVELKYRPGYPKRGSTCVFSGDYGLRPDQKAWIYERALAGVNIWVVAQAEDNLFLVHGRFARELELLDQAALARMCQWMAPARATPWKKLLLVLFE